jgi:hypothetical protein
VKPQLRIRIKASSRSANSSPAFGRVKCLRGRALIAVAIRLRSSLVWVLKFRYTGFSSFDIVMAMVIGNEYRI